ncbi:MAG TPA: amino acid permease [Blastocatellia bacterium]|nr:amino acid permease [Blastocatellia bacterium]
MERQTGEKPNGTSVLTFGGLFRVKSLDAILANADEPEHQLKRALGPVQLTLFGVGAIIGAGIFTTVGTAAAGEAGVRLGAGPALMLSFVITAIACAFTALCYAEFAAMVPISGSAYTYSYATLGEVVAWIIGWDLIIEYAVGNIAVAIGWAQYFNTFLEGFGIHVPDWLVNNYRTATPEVIANAPHIFGKPIVFNLLAILIVALITVVLVWGIRESARFNAVMVGIKILVLLFFIIVGFAWVKPANWTPLAPNGWGGISAGASIIFFAFIGFDAVSTVAEETENPQKNLPVGIIASLIICTILYIAVAAVFTGMIPFDALATKSKDELAEPLTLALRYANANSNMIIGIVAFGSVVATTAVLLVFQLGQPRIFLSMARDGLLPGVFRKVHPKFRTPHISTILTGVFVAVFAAIASIDEVVDLTNIGTLFAFILVCAGIIVLRVREPDRPRPFRVPGGMIFPVLGIISCIYLIYYLPPTSWLRFAAWLNFGFVIYVGYGSMKSVLTGAHTTESKAEHLAHTAHTGMWLLLIGTALLLIMRAFDVWLVAHKWMVAAQDPAANADAMATLSKAEPWLTSLGAKAGAPLASVFSAAPWMEVSFFLIVPLALNAFVLCPIIIRRALRARADGARGDYAAKAMTSIAVASVVALISIGYLLMLVLRQR